MARMQFSLKHLMLFVTCCAGVMAVVRLGWPVVAIPLVLAYLVLVIFLHYLVMRNLRSK